MLLEVLHKLVGCGCIDVATNMFDGVQMCMSCRGLIFVSFLGGHKM